MNFSTYGVNPPNPTGYVPQMMIACMNDPGPIAKTNAAGLYVNAAGTPVPTADLAAQITDPSYNAAYSNFCYETPFMPGFTAYMDTPVIPTQAFADSYNLPDSEYPDGTPAVSSVVNTTAQGPLAALRGPWVSASGQSITIRCLGIENTTDPCSRVVVNPAFSGPAATTAPFNQKTIVRHYGFGGTAGTVAIAGVTATGCSWSNTVITCPVPSIPANLDQTTGIGSTCTSTNTTGTAGQVPPLRAALSRPVPLSPICAAASWSSRARPASDRSMRSRSPWPARIRSSSMARTPPRTPSSWRSMPPSLAT